MYFSFRSCARRSLSYFISRCRRHVIAAIVACLCLHASPVFAIQVSIQSLTLMPDNSASGVYSSPGLGTATWDSQLSVLNSGGTVADAAGASASAQLRYAFAMTAAATGAGTDSFSATSHYRVTFALTNNDPTNTLPVEVNIGFAGSGVSVDDGPAAGFRSEYVYTPAGKISVTSGGVTETANPTPRDSIGFGNGSATGGVGPSATFILPASFTAGTELFTFDVQWTNAIDVNNGGSTVELAGLNSGLNPLLGAIQLYPSAQGHSDPATDGQFLTFTATVAPEPSNVILAGLGGLACLAIRRRR
jgi:hypothetical protein